MCKKKCLSFNYIKPYCCNCTIKETIRSAFSILCATVRRNDASRGCFVDTEKTWFLKYSLFWLSGLLHEATACCELGGATLCH